MENRSRLRSLIPIYIFILCVLVAAGFAGSGVVSTITENTPLTNRNCIVIDAGHGGVDGGAISCSGVLESHINLEISIRLNDLMHLLGMDTVMIRTTDCSVYTEGQTIASKKVSDLKQRVKITNETGNALLISIHQNHFTDSRYNGAQVFYCNDDASKSLAEQLQSTLIQTLNKGSNRQAKMCSGIYLMEHIDCTGILVECGFISNPEEDVKVRDPRYQKKLCSVICSVVSQFLYSENRIA